MLVKFSIEGELRLPEGSRAIEGVANQFVLPNGHVVSVHPVVEVASGLDVDDHRNLEHREAEALGISIEDYDRQAWIVEDHARGDRD